MERVPVYLSPHRSGCTFRSIYFRGTDQELLGTKTSHQKDFRNGHFQRFYELDRMMQGMVGMVRELRILEPDEHTNVGFSRGGVRAGFPEEGDGQHTGYDMREYLADNPSRF